MRRRHPITQREVMEEALRQLGKTYVEIQRELVNKLIQEEKQNAKD